MQSESEIYSFYKLIDPRDNLPFYVGQTLDFERRQKDYLTGKGHSRPLDSRLKELEQAGLRPIMQEVERKVCTASEALERETYWIQSFINQGIVLLNRSNNKTRHTRQTVYLYPDLLRRIRHRIADTGEEISDVANKAIQEFLDREESR